MSTEPDELPTPKQTEDAIKDIDKKVDNENAATALQTLCTAIIRATTEVDRSYDVGRYLKSITLVCNGVGDFGLEVDTDDDAIDTVAIVAATQAEIEADGLDYGKSLRTIQMGDPKDG